MFDVVYVLLEYRYSSPQEIVEECRDQLKQRIRNRAGTGQYKFWSPTCWFGSFGVRVMLKFERHRLELGGSHEELTSSSCLYYLNDVCQFFRFSRVSGFALEKLFHWKHFHLSISPMFLNKINWSAWGRIGSQQISSPLLGCRYI